MILCLFLFAASADSPDAKADPNADASADPTARGLVDPSPALSKEVRSVSLH